MASPFLLVPGIGDRRPGVLAADRPQHHFLSCLVHGQQETQLIEGLLLGSSLGALHVREQLADAPVLLQQNGDDVAVRLLDGLRRHPGEITHR